MKAEKFSKALSEIDEKYIERTLLYKVKKEIPAWVRWTAVAACLCFVMASVALGIHQLRKLMEPKIYEPVPPAEPGELFLIMKGEGVLASNSAGFKNAGNYGVGMSSQETQLEDVKQKISNPLDPSKTMTYSHSYCTPKNSFSDEPGTFYSIYDFYCSDDETFAYLRDSNILGFYQKSKSSVNGAEFSDLSEESALKISDKFLKSTIDNRYLNNITYDDYFETIVTGHYVLRYMRYIFGYQTDETIGVYIDRSGEVIAMNAYNVGKYDSLIPEITKEQIDSAKELLVSKIEALNYKDLKMNTPSLTTDTEGRVFLEIPYVYTDDSGLKMGEIAYVNVN